MLMFILLITCFFIFVFNKNDNNYEELLIKKYSINVKSNVSNHTLKLANNKNDIYYYRYGKKILLKTVQSNSNGMIKNITLKVPKNVNKIYFKHWLCSTKDGEILDKDGNVVNFVSNVNINKTLTNKINKTNTITSDNKIYSYTNTWNIYQCLIKDQREAINYTINELKKDNKQSFNYFSYKPIKIMLTNSSKNGGVLETNSNDKGVLNKNEKYILLKLPFVSSKFDTQKQSETLKVYLSHEWAHWYMIQNIGRNKIPGKLYNSHTSYNKDPRVSYKEGWALFQANRFTWKYNMNVKLDTIVQTSHFENSKYGNKEKLYGKSTNATVYNVLRDLYDLKNTNERNNDKYNISQDVFKNNKYTLSQKEKLSNGLLILAMRESKATTLHELIQYLKKNFINDEASFNQMLKTNGLDKDGNFTLDKKGNSLYNK